MHDDILVSIKDSIQTVRFNRPDKKNAITRNMYAQMTKALENAEVDQNIKCHVIMGTPGVFSSGNDLQDFMAVAEGESMGREVLDFLLCLAGLSKPLISGVDGLAIGIGTTIHMHCDLTFATRESVFKTPFVDLGLVPEAASSLLAPTLIGHQKAYALLAMGRPFSAQEAYDAGLIYDVVNTDSLEEIVSTAAHKLANRPASAMAYTKNLMKPDFSVVKERIRKEVEIFAKQLKSKEAQEAFMAFTMRKK